MKYPIFLNSGIKIVEGEQFLHTINSIDFLFAVRHLANGIWIVEECWTGTKVMTLTGENFNQDRIAIARKVLDAAVNFWGWPAFEFKMLKHLKKIADTQGFKAVIK